MAEPRDWNFVETEGPWTMETVDEDRGDHAPKIKVRISRDGVVHSEMEVEAYRIFTVLAHWRDWLPELESELASDGADNA